MNRSVRNILFPVILLLLSCEKQDTFLSCSDCTATEPAVVKITVNVDPFEPPDLPTEIRVYQGELEDSILLQKIISQNGPIEVSVYINKKYTVTATYRIKERTYIAIDSTTPKVGLESKRCDNPCYYPYNNSVDLRLRYSR